MSLADSEARAYVWSRRTSHPDSRLQDYEHLIDETDTLCLLPSSMRVLCVLLCALLFFSLAAAIFNSLQGNSHGSSSFCKRPDEPFRPEVLCPRETMFFYYVCCSRSNGNGLKCCAEVRVWLLIAIVCVTLSCIIGMSYCFFRFCCSCTKTTDMTAAATL